MIIWTSHMVGGGGIGCAVVAINLQIVFAENVNFVTDIHFHIISKKNDPNIILIIIIILIITTLLDEILATRLNGTVKPRIARTIRSRKSARK